MRKLYIWILLLTLGADRLTKWLVARQIPLEDSVPVIPGFFSLTHLENTGAAFSLFADSTSYWKPILLVLVAVAALIVILWLLWRHGRKVTPDTVALAVIAGGVVGNLWDRVLSGRVTDFLDFYIGVHHWPPFNVADSAIVCGALLLGVRQLVYRPRAASSSN